MNKNILSDDTLECVNAKDKAVQLYAHCKKSDFLYKHENQLYRYKMKPNGGFKIKKLCTAYPEFIKAVNKGNDEKPNWHYLFKVHSHLGRTWDSEILMSPRNLSSNVTFKRALLSVFGALFTGTKDDFDAFAMAAMFDDSID
ncbi:MAG: hypothetical protein Q8N30_07905 [Methylococcales bacterium]|nr:hypothetical protein [Methylococcales bacterium]